MSSCFEFSHCICISSYINANKYRKLNSYPSVILYESVCTTFMFAKQNYVNVYVYLCYAEFNLRGINVRNNTD